MKSERDIPRLELGPEHMMLLRMRETLYEGSWADFEADLRARAAQKPHVFETIPASDSLRSTIDRHLALIAEMRDFESSSGQALKADT